MQKLPLLKFTGKNWFLAKIIYHIICGDGKHTTQFDEQLRLVQAENELQAIKKAKQIGEKEQISFFNCNQKLVQWKFIDVSELYSFDEITDGCELYSRVHEDEDSHQYIDMIRLRASDLLEESMKISFVQKQGHSLVSIIENCIGEVGEKK